MKIIIDYVEQMFKGVPLTRETLQLKTDILANMEDKYSGLKEEGVSEHEAIGIVITEFGNIEELLEELEISSERTKKTEVNYSVIETEEISYYLNRKAKGGLNIGLGVLSILIGLGVALSIMGLFDFRGGSTYVGLIFLIIFLVIGVGLFISEGMRLKELEKYSKPFVLMDADRQMVIDLKEEYKRSYTFSIIMGVSLCILSLSPLFLSLLFDSVFPVLLGVGLTMILVGLGVLFFVYSGNYWHGFNVILENGKPFDTIEQDIIMKARKDKVNHIIEEIYWPIVVVLYFSLSYFLGGWSWSWLIFVLAGALESTIESIFLND